MLRSLNEITGYTLKAIDGDIGRCKDFLFDDRHWAVRYMVADTHKWLPGGRKVLISPISVGDADWESRELPILQLRESIKNSPPLEEHEPVSRRYETEFFKYYGYGYYWMGNGLWGTYPRPTPLVDKQRTIPSLSTEIDSDEQHLRSTQELKGYNIHASDKAIGHIEDFILNDDNWVIPQIAVNTRNWIPGGPKVLISSDRITSVNWADKSISLNMSADEIKNSSEYNSKEFIDPQYENVD